MYKNGQIVTIRRRVVDVSQRPFKIIHQNTICRIKCVPEKEQSRTSPCQLCDAEHIRCGVDCKLKGYLYYETIRSIPSLP